MRTRQPSGTQTSMRNSGRVVATTWPRRQGGRQHQPPDARVSRPARPPASGTRRRSKAGWRPSPTRRLEESGPSACRVLRGHCATATPSSLYVPRLSRNHPSPRSIRTTAGVSTTASASPKSASGNVVQTAKTLAPAARPASMPARVSSMTTHSVGAKPSWRAARRYPAGDGFPSSTSSAARRTLGTGSPTCSRRRRANSRPPDVTTAHSPSESAASSSDAP